MEVKKITPRGYCYGVIDAMVLARKVAQDPSMPRPIYILGMIVHNKHRAWNGDFYRSWRFT
jgi:4-hydroxy-3-methylbut-2-enyl diphosphate reductase